MQQVERYKVAFLWERNLLRHEFSTNYQENGLR